MTETRQIGHSDKVVLDAMQIVTRGFVKEMCAIAS
jgi:hypothetical protein